MLVAVLRHAEGKYIASEMPGVLVLENVLIRPIRSGCEQSSRGIGRRTAALHYRRIDVSGAKNTPIGSGEEVEFQRPTAGKFMLHIEISSPGKWLDRRMSKLLNGADRDGARNRLQRVGVVRR